MRKIDRDQDREHTWKYDGFYDPRTFDEDFWTLQSPGARAGAQCFNQVHAILICHCFQRVVDIGVL